MRQKNDGNTWWLDGGGGCRIWGATDRYASIVAPVTGDADLRVRVVSFTANSDDGKVGLVLRRNARPDAACALLCLRGGTGLMLFVRSQDGAQPRPPIGRSGIRPPHWLRILRRDQRISAFHGDNGMDWEEIATIEAPDLTGTVLAGVTLAGRDRQDGRALIGVPQLLDGRLHRAAP